MKNKRVPILSIITNIILIAILYSFIRINGSVIKEKQIIKEMSESTQVTDLNNQINALNAEHTEYMNYIQTCKVQLASAITEMGVETSEYASIDTMVDNIRSLSGALNTDLPIITAKAHSGTTNYTATSPTITATTNGTGYFSTLARSSSTYFKLYKNGSLIRTTEGSFTFVKGDEFYGTCMYNDGNNGFFVGLVISIY